MDFVKKSGRRLLSNILEWQVRRLRIRHNFNLIAVVGSVGKTSSKISIAKVLDRKDPTRYQEGNYNDRLTVPLVVFGHSNPNMFNLWVWIKIFYSNEKQIKNNFDFKNVVVELGTDGVGQIEEFAYLKPDIAVVTAIAPEHMLQFGTLDAVAKEEMTVTSFSEKTIVNIDDIEERYLHLGGLKNEITISLSAKADYQARLNGQNLKLAGPDDLKLEAKINMLGAQGAKPVILAVAVADQLGYKVSAKDMEAIRPFNGRMNPLPGIKDSLIIDDTYNASPTSVKAALDVVYSMNAPQKIAILGSMNELGNYEKEAHEEVGSYCDPAQLDMVVTIGPVAQKHLAKSATKKGCKVASFASPFDAGEFVAGELKKGALVLAKGSQNRVFSEESLKFLLKNPEDKKHLVRQSDYWLNIKNQQFGRQ